MQRSRFQSAANKTRSILNTSDPIKIAQKTAVALGELIEASAQLEFEHEQLKKAFEDYRAEASAKIDELEDRLGTEE